MTGKINEITDELLLGKGYIMIPSVFSSEEIKLIILNS